jgi:hypothetical protein
LYYLLLLAFAGNSLVFYSRLYIRLVCFGFSSVLVSVVSFSCIMAALRNPSAPIPYDSLHSSPFYLKGPRTADIEKPPETRGHPGCNDKSQNYPRAHKRRIKPPQALSFRYPWDSVSRSHQTVSPYTHNAPTIYSNKKKTYRHYP